MSIDHIIGEFITYELEKQYLKVDSIYLIKLQKLVHGEGGGLHAVDSRLQT